jgi:hypothetical protein
MEIPHWKSLSDRTKQFLLLISLISLLVANILSTVYISIKTEPEGLYHYINETQRSQSLSNYRSQADSLINNATDQLIWLDDICTTNTSLSIDNIRAAKNHFINYTESYLTELAHNSSLWYNLSNTIQDANEFYNNALIAQYYAEVIEDTYEEMEYYVTDLTSFVTELENKFSVNLPKLGSLCDTLELHKKQKKLISIFQKQSQWTLASYIFIKLSHLILVFVHYLNHFVRQHLNLLLLCVRSKQKFKICINNYKI